MHENNILNNLMHIARQPFMFFRNEVQEKTDNAFETLRLLANEENVTAGRIAEHLDIKPSSVTQIIKKLQDVGTAERVKSEEDARVTYVLITDKGRESLKDRGYISENLKVKLFKGFEEDELEKLDDYLTRMLQNISSEDFQKKLSEIFGDDKMWQQFGKMSAHFGRAREHIIREHMVNHSDFGGFRGFGGHGRFGERRHK
ncbi:MarR family transcriptional regulator [Clostridium sporogenes]|uniref:MarR family winged helix-turn-helix transcriptional regulator n=1 Tax=Clostridium sporogenes TaxID=1509 RepID=UPI0013D6FEB8|nr:MarR family transcriptional regulator [Clostridium sporogenes]EJE7234060.1 MarR family transcriptional regulator [Clostridium botulinum]MCF4015871.1 MarR family transcriptional regulator [Clostridium sporogenes]NFE79007.1 MarR family transcriptional regulator [Clostridium sporogenes]NFG67093.1 MarR family transcriptional regulator [Clostridium sporogenes]